MTELFYRTNRQAQKVRNPALCGIPNHKIMFGSPSGLSAPTGYKTPEEHVHTTMTGQTEQTGGRRHRRKQKGGVHPLNPRFPNGFRGGMSVRPPNRTMIRVPQVPSTELKQMAQGHQKGKGLFDWMGPLNWANL